jgi:hypothetical protein
MLDDLVQQGGERRLELVDILDGGGSSVMSHLVAAGES